MDDGSNPREVSNPSDINKTTFRVLLSESNFRNASSTSTYGLYGVEDGLEVRIRSDPAAFDRSGVNDWRTWRLPAVMYPTMTSEPFGSASINLPVARIS